MIGPDRKPNQIDMQSKIYIGGRSMERVKRTKSLGINLDEILSWKTQVDVIAKKVNAGLGILR